MKALADKSRTPYATLKRNIALVLNEAFIGPTHKFNTEFAKDFDDLVDKLAYETGWYSWNLAKWRTIDTAPKDGTRIWLFGRSPDGVEHTNAGFYSEEYSPYGPWRWGITFQPTHWMHLP